MEENILIESIIEKDLSPDKYRLVHNKIIKLEQENKYLEDKLIDVIRYLKFLISKTIDNDYISLVKYLEDILKDLGVDN